LRGPLRGGRRESKRKELKEGSGKGKRMEGIGEKQPQAPNPRNKFLVTVLDLTLEFGVWVTFQAQLVTNAAMCACIKYFSLP